MAETAVITASSINKVRIKFVQIFMMICIKDETSKLTEVFESKQQNPKRVPGVPRTRRV